MKKSDVNFNADLEGMSPISDEVRLHSESESEHNSIKDHESIKRVKPKEHSYFNNERKSVTRKVHIEAREQNQPEIIRPNHEMSFSS